MPAEAFGTAITSAPAIAAMSSTRNPVGTSGDGIGLSGLAYLPEVASREGDRIEPGGALYDAAHALHFPRRSSAGTARSTILRRFFHEGRLLHAASEFQAFGLRKR